MAALARAILRSTPRSTATRSWPRPPETSTWPTPAPTSTRCACSPRPRSRPPVRSLCRCFRATSPGRGGTIRRVLPLGRARPPRPARAPAAASPETRTQAVFALGDPAADLHLRGRGAGRRGGPAGPAVRRPHRPAARPAARSRSSASAATTCTSPTSCTAGRPATATRGPRRSPPAAPTSSASSTSSRPAVVVTLGQLRRPLLLETTVASPGCGARAYPFRARRPRPTLHPAFVLRGGGAPARPDARRPVPGQAGPRRPPEAGSRGGHGGPRPHRVRRRDPRPAAAVAGLVAARRHRGARRRAGHGQDRVRPGLRRGARHRRAHRQPDVHPRPPVRAAGSPCSTSTCTGSSSSTETLDLGLAELLDDGAVALIEWGDVIVPVLPARTTSRSASSYGDDDDDRRFAFAPPGTAGWPAAASGEALAPGTLLVPTRRGGATTC